MLDLNENEEIKGKYELKLNIFDFYDFKIILNKIS